MRHGAEDSALVSRTVRRFGQAARLLVVLATLAPFVAGCGRAGPAVADAGAEGAGAERAGPPALARGLLAPGVPLPPRAEVLALAQTVEALAQREGAGARAGGLHAVAARLYAREFRAEGHRQDAEEAIVLARSASRDLAARDACDAALLAAHLEGELAGDAETTYVAAYRLERRAQALVASEPAVAGAPPAARGNPTSAAAVCLLSARALVALLAPFRPAAPVLEAIEHELAGAGAVARPPPAPGDSPAPATSSDGPRGPARVVRVEHFPGRDAARVVVVLDRPAPFRAGDEPGAPGRGPRTYIDLDGVELGAAARDAPGDGMVVRVRVTSTSSGSRLTLDLDGHGYRRVFYLPEPFRVVVDLAREPPGARGKRSVARVALDPGHGGSDPGALGPAGLREKDVTLDVAHRLAPVLSRQGIIVLMTRDDDRFVPLEERTARANAFAADVFVSIHCNAAENHAHRGVETYVLDTAKGDMGARLAARENATSATAAAEVGHILATMRLADQATRSAHLAELFQRATLASLSPSYTDTVDGGVHTAGFYVLVGARMPAVLFEASYISNAVDEQRLASEDYRQRLADGIANALRAYREGR